MMFLRIILKTKTYKIYFQLPHIQLCTAEDQAFLFIMSLFLKYLLFLFTKVCVDHISQPSATIKVLYTLRQPFMSFALAKDFQR